MKTKEQFIHEMFSVGNGSYNPKDLCTLMESYAQQQAIAFLQYKQEQGYILEHARNEYMKFGAAHIHEPRLSPEALYAQFIESQSTNNKE